MENAYEKACDAYEINLRLYSKSSLTLTLELSSTEMASSAIEAWAWVEGESGLLYSLSEQSRSKNVGWFVFKKLT